MTDSVVIFGLDVRIISSFGVVVALFFSVRIAWKSHELQKKMGKNAVLNIKYQNEINHLQQLINRLAEIRTWAFDINNPKRDEELDRAIDDMVFNVNVLKALETSTSTAAEQWEISKDYGNTILRLIYYMLKQQHAVLNQQSDGEYFSKKQKDLNNIQEKLFQDITKELGF